MQAFGFNNIQSIIVLLKMHQIAQVQTKDHRHLLHHHRVHRSMLQERIAKIQ